MSEIDSLMNGTHTIHPDKTLQYIAGLIRLAYRLGANNNFKGVNTSRIEKENQLRKNTLNNNITAAISTKRLSYGGVGLLWTRDKESPETKALIDAARIAKVDILEKRYTENVANLLTETCKYCRVKPRVYSDLGKEFPNHDF